MCHPPDHNDIFTKTQLYLFYVYLQKFVTNVDTGSNIILILETVKIYWIISALYLFVAIFSGPLSHVTKIQEVNRMRKSSFKNATLRKDDVW